MRRWRLLFLAPVNFFRAPEWWDYKLPLALLLYYATGFLLRVPIASCWRNALILLVALTAQASYVSVLNDATDRAEDAAAGKSNRLLGKSSKLVFCAFAVCISAGLLVVFHWRHDPPLVIMYGSGWLAFTLYSTPPFRLKTRGFAGVMADAAGAHLFPALLAIVLAYRSANRSVDFSWLSVAAVWSFAFGLRGILWHQFNDLENDRRISISTFTVLHTGSAAAIVKFLIFPVELVALTWLFAKIGSVWPPASLALYAAILFERWRRWDTVPVIVVPADRPYVLLCDRYYGLYFPLGVLIASATRFPVDWLIVAAQLCLFPRPVLQEYQIAVHLCRLEVRRLVR